MAVLGEDVGAESGRRRAEVGDGAEDIGEGSAGALREEGLLHGRPPWAVGLICWECMSGI